MKIVNLLFLLLFCLPVSLLANIPDSIFDKAPFENPDYIGYRMAVTNMTFKSESNGSKLNISYKIINTGRQDLLFGKKMSAPPYLVVNFDHTLAESGLYEYAEDIKNAILDTDFIIKRGEISRNMQVNVATSSNKRIVKPTEEIVELPDYMKQSGSENDPMVIGGAPANTKKESLAEEFGSDIEQLTSKGMPDVDEEACSDLAIESIRVVKKSKKQVTLEYTIINTGPGPAKIINSQKKEEKNMALKAHFSTKEKMTKGSLTFGGGFIEGGLESRDGKLYPGEKYKGTLELNIQKMTDFTPYIILELDPYLSVSECDKTNNKGAIKVGEGRPGLN